MHVRIRRQEIVALVALSRAAAIAVVIGLGACTTTQIDPMPPLPAEAPGYVKVPHPEGLDLGDLMAIFTDRDAPSPEKLATCDKDFQKLRSLTQSKDELQQGAREFVRKNPVDYHWCFYRKVMALEEELKAEPYVDERQKKIIEAYLFLTPVARAFFDEYHDSRYLRWAIARYRRFSEYVFYRKLEVSPETATELGGTVNPFGTFRRSEDAADKGGVLEKYGLIRTDDAAPKAAAQPVEGAPVVQRSPAGLKITPDPISVPEAGVSGAGVVPVAPVTQAPVAVPAAPVAAPVSGMPAPDPVAPLPVPAVEVPAAK